MFLKSEKIQQDICALKWEKKEKKIAEDKADILFAAASAKHTKYIP